MSPAFPSTPLHPPWLHHRRLTPTSTPSMHACPASLARRFPVIPPWRSSNLSWLLAHSRKHHYPLPPHLISMPWQLPTPRQSFLTHRPLHPRCRSSLHSLHVALILPHPLTTCSPVPKLASSSPTQNTNRTLLPQSPLPSPPFPKVCVPHYGIPVGWLLCRWSTGPSWRTRPGASCLVPARPTSSPANGSSATS